MSNFRKIFTCIHCQGVYADQPVSSCDCRENTGSIYNDAVIVPCGKGYSVVDSGALKMAINVLRHAGKNEVADELENLVIRI